MTKADIVHEISRKTGIDKAEVLATVEAFMAVVKTSLEKGENVYFRGFGSFNVVKRARKIGRNIVQNQPIVIPAHFVPVFKPAEEFIESVKANVKVNENE